MFTDGNCVSWCPGSVLTFYRRENGVEYMIAIR